MGDWSSWKEISRIDEVAVRFRCPGVYKIRLADQQEKAMPIPRFLGADKEGLLAIGESKNLSRRIRQFYRAYSGQSFRHSVAERLFLLLFKWINSGSTVKTSRLEFSCMKLRDKAEAQTAEEMLLKTYFKKFGELPPLNSSLPDKHVDWRKILIPRRKESVN